MSKFSTTAISTCFFLCFILFFISENAQAQKYKKLSDTTKLNKEYAEVSLDIANLNSKLAREKRKTAGYQSNTSSSSDIAVSSAQRSKDQAAVATNGNTSDTRRAVRDAKRANRKANRAENAESEERDNSKNIIRLQAQIDKKQARLNDLDMQRAAIMGKLIDQD